MMMHIITTFNENVNYFSLDHCLVYLFLAITLFIGWYVGRGMKDIDDYALGGRSYSTLVLTLTMLATLEGGTGTMGLSAGVFSDGIIMTATILGNFIAFLFIALFIAPRMLYFEGCITIGEVVGKLYGARSKVVAAMIGFLFCMLIVGSQTLAIGYVCETLLGVKKNAAIWIGGLIVAFYSAWGGIKSVTATDVLQFGVLIVMIPLIANVATSDVGGIEALLNKVPKEKLTIIGHEKFDYYLVLFLVLGVFPDFVAHPAVVQRMLMARDRRQASDVFSLTAGFDIPFTLMITLIGLAAVAAYSHIDANIALPHVVKELFPEGTKGLAIAGLLAVVMSTSDSFLNAGGLLLTHDIIQPVLRKSKVAFNELHLTRGITFLLGLGGIFIALISSNIIKLGFYAESILGATLTIPLIAGILGLKPDAKSFFIAMFMALAAFIGAVLYLPEAQQYLAPAVAIVANGLAFFGAHFMQNDGFKVVKWEEGASVPWKTKWHGLQKWFTKDLPKDLLHYSKNKVKAYGASYVMFAVFCCFNYVVPLFMWTHKNMPHYITLFVIRLIAGGLCVGLLAKEYWPARLKPYFPAYWHFTLLYCLPMMTTLMFIVMGGSAEWIVNIALSIMLLILLVDWLTFILLSVGGVALGILFHHLLIAQGVLAPVSITGFSTIYLLIYTCVFATLIGLLFARKKEEAIESDKRLIKLYAANIAHDLDNTIGSVEMFSSGLDAFLKHAPIKAQTDQEGKKSYHLPESVYEFVENLPKELRKESDKGYQVIKMMLEAVKRGSMLDPTKLKEHSLKACVADVLQGYHVDDEQRENITFIQAHDFTVLADKHALWHVLYNLLKNAHRYAGYDCKITLWLDDTNRRLHIKDDGEGIPRAKLSKIFESFYTGSSIGSGIGLGMCKTIMEGLGGRIYCKSQQGEGSYAEFVMEFPPVEEAKKVLGV